MLRVVEDCACVSALHHLALLHDDDPVADVIGGRKVVRDIDDRDAEIVAERLEQVNDGHSKRSVDHRDRLVCNDQRWARNKRPGYRDTLQLAARKLVREAPVDLDK